MNSFWRIFSFELIGFIRSKTAAMLLVASVAWVYALPFVVKGDGTAEGMRELSLRYSLGGVFVLLVLSLLASATGSLARERAAKRLQLTLVRPVSGAALVLAKWAAHVALGACVLGVAGAVPLMVVVKDGSERLCHHVLKPVLPSPREEAREMYAAFMADPETPSEAKRAKKAVVLRLLENKAIDHYQTIPTNEVVAWKFRLNETLRRATSDDDRPRPAVRLRLTNQFDARDDVRGRFVLNGFSAVVNTITQAVLTVPLAGDGHLAEEETLSFVNEGKNPLMLRPRKDLDLLVPADSFYANYLRTYLTLVAILSLAVAFGLFLSAALGRPVALFTALVMLLVSEMSPSVIEQYPDELETKMLDRIGLSVSRLVAETTRPVAALNPLEKLAQDECVEWSLTVKALAVNAALMPILFALLAGFILPRKPEDP